MQLMIAAMQIITLITAIILSQYGTVADSTPHINEAQFQTDIAKTTSARVIDIWP